jgi:hypothetical protein
MPRLRKAVTVACNFSMTLPNDIKQIFLETLSGEKTVLEFEQWLYNDKRLEKILNSEDYLDLISYGYKADNAKGGLVRLLEKHVDKGELETTRIRKLLTKALYNDKDLPAILMTFYDSYCKGYSFLDNLALGYGIRVEVPAVNNYEETWDDLTKADQTNLINSFYPGLETEIKKVISWLDTGKVILTGVLNENNHFEYIDNRTELEKKPTGYTVVDVDNSSRRRWWKIW